MIEQLTLWFVNHWAAGLNDPVVYQGWIVPAIMAGSAILSALAGSKGKKETTSSNFDKTTESQKQDFWDQFSTKESQASGTEAPTMDPFQATTRDAILSAFLNRLRSGQDMQAYAGQGYRNINQGADIQRRAMANLLAQRGLSGSAVGANAMATTESGRIGNIVNFANTLPLVQRQQELEDLTNFGNFWAKMPFGRTWNQQGYDVNQGFGSNLTRGYDHSYGTGNELKTTPSNYLAAGGSIISQLAALYGMRNGKKASGNNAPGDDAGPYGD